MNIAIVDDMKQDRLELLNCLKKYFTNQQIDVNISEFSSSEELLNVFEPKLFSLVFLDIYMTGKNGMELARHIYKTDPTCKIIFVTSSTADAISSYEVRAVWYLTKPLSYTKFLTAMDIACAELFKEKKSVVLNSKKVPVHILLSDIFYIDCVNSIAQLHLQNQTISLDERITSITDILLQDKRFLVSNRNVIVNMDHIAKAEENYFVMKNQEIVSIRLRGKSTVKKDFLYYSLQKLRSTQNEE